MDVLVEVGVVVVGVVVVVPLVEPGFTVLNILIYYPLLTAGISRKGCGVFTDTELELEPVHA